MARTNGQTFHVDASTHFLGGLVARRPRLWIRLGNLETRLLADALAATEIRQPIYVAGLARSGTTLLLEFLSWHGEVVTHRYRDFPMLHVPYAWNRFLDRTPQREAPPAERAHGDGIVVTRDSPEAFEEMLWMSFFPGIHDAGSSAVLGADTHKPAFEAFYRDHIRKLLLLRGGSRYVSKGNYNLTRLEYLLRLFPDARFVIPYRDPVWHIASLMKQHRLFCDGQREDPRALAHLQRAGHFEFGLDRRPINAGDTEQVDQVTQAWASGAEVEGWARYWAHVHAYLAERLERHPELRRATLLVPYERLCRKPGQTLRALFEHCGLPASDELLQRAQSRVRFPDYYRPEFSPEEEDTIARHTQAVAARLDRLANSEGDEVPASREAALAGSRGRGDRPASGPADGPRNPAL